MKKSFRKLFDEAEQDPAFWAELAILEVTEEIHAAMERSGVTRSELARRLGTSPAYVTKILRGNANFTLESLARVTRALGSKIRFHIAPAESKKHGPPPSTVRFDPKPRRPVVKPPGQPARAKAKGRAHS